MDFLRRGFMEVLIEMSISSEAVWQSIREWALSQERQIWKLIEDLEEIAQEEEEFAEEFRQIGDRLMVELEALDAITAATPEVVAELGEKDFGDIERLLMDQARMLGRCAALIMMAPLGDIFEPLL